MKLVRLALPLILWMTLGPVTAQRLDSEPVPIQGQIVLDSRGIFSLGASDPETLAARTALVQARLNRVLANYPGDLIVTTRQLAAGWVLLINDQQIVTITAQDTKRHNTSAQALGAEWATSLKNILQDQAALNEQRKFNILPETVVLKSYGYGRTNRLVTADAFKIVTTGQVSFRNQIFTATTDPIPREVYLRSAEGDWMVYELLSNPDPSKKPTAP